MLMPADADSEQEVDFGNVTRQGLEASLPRKPIPIGVLRDFHIPMAISMVSRRPNVFVRLAPISPANRDSGEL